MDSTENKPGVPETGDTSTSANPAGANPAAGPAAETPSNTVSGQTSHDPVNDGTNAYSYYDDYGYDHHNQESGAAASETTAVAADQALTVSPSPPPPPPPPPPPSSSPDSGSQPEGEAEEDDGMLRMSFMEHLDELRTRILHALYGIGVAFVACIYFTPAIWNVIRQPYVKAMELNGVQNAELIQLSPGEAFSILWVKLPILCAIFLSSPWLLFQVWSFISPGLYKHERRWAGPFIVGSAFLFILGGLFAYFVAFPLGLGFLLGIGSGMGIKAQVTLSEYFDLFFNVELGMGIVFELPVLIFVLALLRVVTPHFLMRHSRYAILLIVIVAAIITPTPDVINLMLISVPMTLLYFTGVFASYVLYLNREGKRLPWLGILGVLLGLFLLLFGSIYLLLTRYGYKLVQHWPFLVR